MYGYIIMAAIAIISMVTAYLLAPKPKTQNAKALNLDEFTVPTNTNGRVIPVIFGTVEIKGNCLWYGDLRNDEIKQSAGSKKAPQTVGYAYSLGVAYGICERVDKLIAFKLDNDVTATPYLKGSGTFLGQTGKCATTAGSEQRTYDIELILPNGKVNLHEVKGYSEIKFYDGTQTEPNEYLSAQTGYELAYKNLAYFVVNGFVGDNVQSIPIYSCVCQRTDLNIGTAGSNYANINNDINPAHALYYILTELIGVSKDYIDIDSFSRVAYELYNDNFGISFVMSSANESKEWIEEILRTIDGVLSINQSTGKLILKLLRYDFKENELRKINENDYKDLVFKRKSWDDTYSRISIKYTDRGNFEFKENLATAINNAVKETLGYEKSDTIEYMSITNSINASKVLNRVMRKMTYPYATLTFKVSIEKFRSVSVGDVLLFSNKALNVENLKIRIVNLGADKEDDQSLEIEAIEDVFSLENIHITSEQESLYKPIDYNIGDLEYVNYFEAPIEMGEEQAILPLVVKPSGYVQSVVCKDGTQGQSINCEFFSLARLENDFNISDEFNDDDFFIVREITPLWKVSATRAGFQRLKMVCLIDNEVINFQFREPLDNGLWKVKTLMRGIVGTKITKHKKNALVWFSPVDANELMVLPIISPNATIHFTAKNQLQNGKTKSLSVNHSQNAKRAYSVSNLYAIRNNKNVTLFWRNCTRLHGANYRNADNILAGADENLIENSVIIEYNDNVIELKQGESYEIKDVPQTTTFKLYSVGINGMAYKSDMVSVVA